MTNVRDKSQKVYKNRTYQGFIRKCNELMRKPHIRALKIENNTVFMKIAKGASSRTNSIRLEIENNAKTASQIRDLADTLYKSLLKKVLSV